MKYVKLAAACFSALLFVTVGIGYFALVVFGDLDTQSW